MDKAKVVCGSAVAGVGAIETMLTAGSCPMCILATVAGVATALVGAVEKRAVSKASK